MKIKELGELFKEHSTKRLAEEGDLNPATLQVQKSRFINDKLSLEKQIEILKSLGFGVKIKVL